MDTDSQLVTESNILPGNAPGVLVEQSEENTGILSGMRMGMAGRGNAGRTLIAKVPGRPNKACFPKEDPIDLEAGTCTCPAGNVTHTLRTFGTRTNRLGRTYLARSFQFDPAVCASVCPLRSQCWRGESPNLATSPGEVPALEYRRLSIAWRFWCNWGSALATSAEPRIPTTHGGHGGQPDPGGYR